MNENNVRYLLHDIADMPEPAPRVDIGRARRTGLRRLWARRAAIPLAVAAVLAVVVIVPQALAPSAAGHSDVTPAVSGSGGSPAATPAPKTTATATAQADAPSPDGYLNPLVPYAAFGYLPQGYSLDITPSAIHDGFLSTVDNLTITAAQSAGGDFIQLSVMPKGGCYGLLSGIPGWSVTQDQQARCSELTGQESSKAPDVNGRMAYWGKYGTDLAWQYAPDSWAVLQAQSSGNTGFPAAQAQTLLPQVAARVKFGQTQPVIFPFKLSGAVPADWHAVSASYTVSPAGQYLANQLDVAPYADYEAHGVTGLIIGAAQTPDVNGDTCIATTQAGPGETKPVISYVRHDGVSWLVETPPQATGTNSKSAASRPTLPPNDNATACNQQPDGGLYASADLKTDTTGAAGTGGIAKVLGHLSILGANAASWTSKPLSS